MTPPDLTRRGLLAGAAGVAGAAALGSRAEAAASKLPAPGASGIDHIVVLMMENRSFDHYLGWLKTDEAFREAHRERYRRWPKINADNSRTYVAHSIPAAFSRS
jgi:phospholipase C